MGRKLDVSVIIPAYNSETTIERAINSVVSQEHAVDEITVVDDGFSARYYFQDNGGVYPYPLSRQKCGDNEFAL